MLHAHIHKCVYMHAYYVCIFCVYTCVQNHDLKETTNESLQETG